jgi:hypothetical protein
MHEKFGLANTTGATHLSKEEKDFRVAALQEELNEYSDAESLVDQYDALLDLIVFAVGSLERHGFPLQEGFEIVMRANMAKEVGQNGSKRGGFKRDLVKPAGWQSPEPELENVLSKPIAIGGVPRPVQWPPAPTTQSLPPGSDGMPVQGFAPKYDAGKMRLDLVPASGVMAAADVFGYGAQKYYANSWRSGEMVTWSRTYGSIQRHLLTFWSGENVDPESGKPHLSHAITQLMILIEHQNINKKGDDRHV